MKRHTAQFPARIPSSAFSLVAVVLLLAGTALSARATQATQSFSFQPGWNAIWLEVSPVIASGDNAGEASPIGSVLTDPSLSTVARPVNPVGTTEFISDPTDTFNQEGWIVWHRDSTSGNTLTTLRGNQAYLVFNADIVAINQDITGEVRYFEPTWSGGNYNLLGFGISGSPTFAEFFGSAGESGSVHPISKLFTLNPATGNWESVQDSDPMASGAAYWIFAERNSTFSGPVAIDFDGIGDWSFGTEGSGDLVLQDSLGADLILTPRELTFTNVDGSDHDVTIAKVDPGTSGTAALADELRLFPIVPEPGSLSYILGSTTPISNYAVGTISSLSTTNITVGANRNWTAGGNLRENLYRIEVALGSGSATQNFWLPAEAARTDAGDETLGTPDSRYAGLWIGQVVLDSVTSIAIDGNPQVGTTSVLPMPVLIHVDAGGNASLLSHVMFMQTKTADESVAPQSVLVIDEAKIPFFEGIQVRDGKRVGRRIETAAYDLPRLFDATTQAGIRDLALTPTVAADLGVDESAVTTTDIDTYVLNQAAADLGIPPASVTAEQLAAYESDPDSEVAGLISTFVAGSESRPVDLSETYYLSFPLEGALGPNSVVQTPDATPLTSDPFHRSNPFRHAFHPLHGTGIEISRALSITFDDTNADGLLTGLYTDSFDGLTNLAAPLVASGRIELRRISDIGDLQ